MALKKPYVLEKIDTIESNLAEMATYYANVQSMQQDSDLKEGSTCVTLGYYASGDYGAAQYVVSNTGTADGMTTIALNNGKFAIFIPNQEGIYPEQFGAYGYVNRSQSNPTDSTPQFQALINYITTNNSVYNMPILLNNVYYVHELTIVDKMPYFKGVQLGRSFLIYNGVGGTNSNVLQYTGQLGGNMAYGSGGLENVSLYGNNPLNNNPIAEYGVLFKKADGNNTVVDGIDFGYKLINVQFNYFLKDGFNASAGWTINFTIDKVRFDAVNGYGLNLNVNAGQWLHIHDFTVDYIARNNAKFISDIQTLNGSANKCGIGMLYINTDGFATINIENARIEGETWHRNIPTNTNLYSNIYINSSSTGSGCIELNGLTLSGDSNKNIYLVAMVNQDIGVNIHNCNGYYNYNALVYYSRTNNSGVIDNGTRIGQLGSSLLYVPQANSNNRGVSINGIGISAEAKIPSQLSASLFFRKYDIYLLTKSNIYMDYESPTTRPSLGYVCTYPNSGFGVNKLISQGTISVTQGDASINYSTITAIFGNGALPLPYLSMTITYTDATTQVVNIGNIDYTNKLFYLMGTDGSSSATISKTDSAAKINITVAQFKPFGYIKEILSGSTTFNGDGVMTSKTIAHGCATTPTFYSVVPSSADAGTSGVKYVTADATNLTVYFNTPPVSGTNNITLKWKAEA